MKFTSYLILGMLALMGIVLAQEAVIVDAIEVSESIPGESLFELILSAIEGAGKQVAIIAIVLEFVLRAIPSKKPLSVLIVVAQVVHFLARIFEALSKFLDRLLQNVKPSELK
jgi:CBS domain containing-hemolysin-like protein